MIHDAKARAGPQADQALAERMRRELRHFLRPYGHRLAQRLDIRLVLTALALVQVIVTHRHSKLGLLLSELGGYLLGPAHAPAGTKRISNLLQARAWGADDLRAGLWAEAETRVQALQQAGAEVLLVWDGSVWEKPESQAGAEWCLVRSAKARRLARRRKGLTGPPPGPAILVPGLHWEGLVVLGMEGPPSLADVLWWSTRGEHATSQEAVNQELLSRAAGTWGRNVRHIWDRGYVGSPWVQAALAADIRFVLRWKKGVKLLDNWGDERKAWEIARGKRSQHYHWLREPQSKELIKVGVLAIPVTLVDHAHPLWLVLARLGHGREPWYLLTADPLRTAADAWAVVLAYARRWQIEGVWRVSKSELAFESPRVQGWEVRQKLLLLASLAYAFLVHLLDPPLAELCAMLLRAWGHRTGNHVRQAALPLYRLRAALSRLWLAAPPPGCWPPGPGLNSG